MPERRPVSRPLTGGPMFRTARRLTALTTIATGAAVLAGVALAAAHIETNPPAVQAGTQATVGFVVEHGCGESNTTGMDIKLPAGITDATASKPGWTVTVADGVVRFSGGDLDHDTEDTFDISFTAPTTTGFVSFPTVQISGDTEQPWLAETVEDAETTTTAAAVTTTTQASTTTAPATTAATTTAAPTTAAATTVAPS